MILASCILTDAINYLVQVENWTLLKMGFSISREELGDKQGELGVSLS